ncbi:unnamed protein product [Scytosiphon promiscuus]
MVAKCASPAAGRSSRLSANGGSPTTSTSTPTRTSGRKSRENSSSGAGGDARGLRTPPTKNVASAAVDSSRRRATTPPPTPTTTPTTSGYAPGSPDPPPLSELNPAWDNRDKSPANVVLPSACGPPHYAGSRAAAAVDVVGVLTAGTAGTGVETGPEGGGGPSAPHGVAAVSDGYVSFTEGEGKGRGIAVSGRDGGQAEVLGEKRVSISAAAAAAALAAAAVSGKIAESGGYSEDDDEDDDDDDYIDVGTGVDSIPPSSQPAAVSAPELTTAPVPTPAPSKGRNVVSLQMKNEEMLPPSAVPPSACTTPAESPRVGYAVVEKLGGPSPAVSPRPMVGAVGNGGGFQAASTLPAAVGALVNKRLGSDGRDRSKSPRRPGNGDGDGGGGGEGGGETDRFRPITSPMSSGSKAACSPRAVVSPPPPFTNSTSPSWLQQHHQQRGAPFGSGRIKLEGSEWWKGLDLSPDRSGLPKWRESRKPASSAAPCTSGSTTDDNDGGASTRTSSVPDPKTPTTIGRMSRSYMTLLAAAAADGDGKWSGKGERDAAGRSPADRSSRLDSEVSTGEQASSVEGRLRQLEAENLRLRFRVADLEGQVSVMEDELDRRGVSRPVPYDTATKAAGSGTRRRRTSSNGKGTKHAAAAMVSGGRKNDDMKPGVSEAAGRRWPAEAEGADGGRGCGSPTTVPKPQDDVAGTEAREAKEGVPGGEAVPGANGEGPLLSPRGRGYLARLVLEVCSELEDSKNKAKAAAMTSFSTVGADGAAIPQSERLCKVLPRVMETAIKGVKDLDEQVFEQMMRKASERAMPMPTSTALASPSRHHHHHNNNAFVTLGTPARRLSSCVVARDGGGEFFAQSPAPGRPASFFRIVGEPQTPCAGTSSSTAMSAPMPRKPRNSLGVKSSSKAYFGRGSAGGNSEAAHAASGPDVTPAKALANGARRSAEPSQSSRKALRETPRKNGGATSRTGGASGFFGAGDWLAAAFTPKAAFSSEPFKRSRAAAPATDGDRKDDSQEEGGEGEGEEEGIAPLPPPPQPRASSESDALSFEGSTEEVLRYTIVAKSYLIRSKSKRKSGTGADQASATPMKSVFSPKGTERKVLDGGEDDLRHLTKELLDLKTRYMAATQHWLKTDIVNDEELRMIRAQVFEAIQRKRSELHNEAAAVLRAERFKESRRLQASDNGSDGGLTNIGGGGDGDGDSGAGGRGRCDIDDHGGNKSTVSAAVVPATAAVREEEEEANRTIKILIGTAEFLKFSRLLLLLSEAISVSASVAAASRAESADQTAAASKSRGSSTDPRVDGSGDGSVVSKAPSSPPPSQQQQLQKQLLHRMALS